ncbi:hypothetical protein K1719_035713 [Acacia pycnantha]|nr:hypothetical protein K1719_035713 [Acacia pycnantha]
MQSPSPPSINQVNGNLVGTSESEPITSHAAKSLGFIGQGSHTLLATPPWTLKWKLRRATRPSRPQLTWIIIKSWTRSWLSYLYLPLFVSGLIKYGEMVWALKSSLSKRFGIITVEEIDKETSMLVLFRMLPHNVPYIEPILMAYYRSNLTARTHSNFLYMSLFPI